MAYIARPSGNFSGVYAYVLERTEQEAARHPEFTSTGNGGFYRCPHHQRLEAMRRGEPVMVPSHLLPRQVRQSAAYQRATRGISRNGNAIRRPTAVVHLDGRITYRDPGPEQWDDVLPGEFSNYSGPPPEDYALDYNFPRRR